MVGLGGGLLGGLERGSILRLAGGVLRLVGRLGALRPAHTQDPQGEQDERGQRGHGDVEPGRPGLGQRLAVDAQRVRQTLVEDGQADVGQVGGRALARRAQARADQHGRAGDLAGRDGAARVHGGEGGRAGGCAGVRRPWRA
ncbi:hypothetical protein [Nonomuraea salmonea]|uniref:hypothetical protein n=1 Tax=Nonomuraea salmonea TaxID=46181 RepID=UPI0031EADABC